MLYMCSEMFKPERSKDMVNLDNFVDPEYFILPFVCLSTPFCFHGMKYSSVFIL